MRRCFCIGAMSFDNFGFDIGPKDFVIAADGGLRNCEKFGIKPDIILGDFDSLGYVPDGKNVKQLPVEKDVTDMYKAALTGVEHGYKVIALFGGVGGRPDHTFANIALLADLADRGCKAFMFSDDYVIVALKNDSISFHKSLKGTISVFSFTNKSTGVCEKGLKYTLSNACLTNKFPLGVSNSFIGEEAEISVKRGTLIIMYERP